MKPHTVVNEYRLNNIRLLDDTKLINDIMLARENYTEDIYDKLHFTKKYDTVRLDLTNTSLISDMINIIMTYVNDDFVVKYRLNKAHPQASIGVYCKLKGNIWLKNYDVWFLFWINNRDLAIFFSEHNTGFSTAHGYFHMEKLDRDYEIHNKRSNSNVESLTIDSMMNVLDYEITHTTLYITRLIKQVLDELCKKLRPHVCTIPQSEL